MWFLTSATKIQLWTARLKHLDHLDLILKKILKKEIIKIENHLILQSQLKFNSRAKLN